METKYKYTILVNGKERANYNSKYHAALAFDRIAGELFSDPRDCNQVDTILVRDNNSGKLYYTFPLEPYNERR